MGMFTVHAAALRGGPRPQPFPPRAHPSKQRRWVGDRDVQCAGLPSPPLPGGVQDAEPSQSCQGRGQGSLAGQAGGQNQALQSPRLTLREAGGQVGHAALEKEVKQPSGITGALTPSPDLPLARRRVGRGERSGRGKPGGSHGRQKSTLQLRDLGQVLGLRRQTRAFHCGARRTL